MNKINIFPVTCLFMILAGCSPVKQKEVETVESYHTVETENLLSNLKKIADKGFMFGHHDDTLYGIGWEDEEGRSDVQSVCGDYPAVISFDLGHLELGDSLSLDKVLFTNIRREILNQYKRGGISSLSWHPRNPVTGGDAWDVSDNTVVTSVLPGGKNYVTFTGWVERVAVFLNSLVTEEGVKVPVLFRPWHENTGSWFWWGENLCTVEEYKTLWQLTIGILRDNGVDNALYAYSPGGEPKNTTQYLQRYPGDEWIDVIGFDTYQFDRDVYLEGMERMLSILDSIGTSHDKVIAVTETGYEGIPDPQWWTSTLLPVVEKYPVAYLLVWRNARERTTHYYAPYPGHGSAGNFVEFYNHPKTLFASDIQSLYK